MSPSDFLKIKIKIKTKTKRYLDPTEMDYIIHNLGMSTDNLYTINVTWITV